jgi:hypothetical protein
MTRRHHRKSGARRIAVVLAAIAALSLTAIGPGRAFGAVCDGHLAAPGDDASYQPGPGGVTIDRSTSLTPVVIIGSEGNDTLIGGHAGDFICGRGGNDHIEGGDGADTIYGNTGSDTIIGGNGADKLVAGWGLDDYINAIDVPPVDDPTIEAGFGLKHCDVDVADTHVYNCTPVVVGGRAIGLNPLPLPFP